MNKQIEAISYMPLDKAIDNPDLIVIIAKPIQIFNLIRAHAYTNSERIDCNVSRTQSLCGDITSNTYNSNQAKISFGCMGSHMATELEEDHVIMSIPFDRLEEFTEALSIVTQPLKRP